MIYRPIDVIQENNLQELAALYVQSFSVAPWNEKWTTETAGIRIEAILRTPGFIGFQAEEKGKIIGFILGFTEQYQYDKTFQIKEICVDPALQKKGIGKGLIRTMEAELRRIGIGGVYLITTRQGAVEKFYKSSGFSENTHLLVMQKPLKNNP